MRFYDHRATRRQRGRRITSRRGIGQGKIRCAEYRYWSQRPQHGAGIGLRQRSPVRGRSINPRIHPRPIFHHAGKHPQLPAGPRRFALDAGLRQPCLRHRPVCQGLSQRFDIFRDPTQESPARLPFQITESRERLSRQLHSRFQIVCRRGVKHYWQFFTGRSGLAGERNSACGGTLKTQVGKSGKHSWKKKGKRKPNPAPTQEFRSLQARQRPSQPIMPAAQAWKQLSSVICHCPQKVSKILCARKIQFSPGSSGWSASRAWRGSGRLRSRMDQSEMSGCGANAAGWGGVMIQEVCSISPSSWPALHPV